MSPAAPRDSTAFEVREALENPGCAVCALSLRSVGRWLVSVAYDQVNDIQLRDELRAARGFCNVHAHRWLHEVHTVLGTAIVYQDLLKASLRDLGDDPPPRASLWRSIVGNSPSEVSGCPACRVQAEAEERYMAALLSLAAADADLMATSDGLCVRHARAAIRRGGEGADRIVDQTRTAIERLLDELSEVIRKEDYRFRDEPRTDQERTATNRAVARAAGAEGLVAPLLQRGP